MWYDASDTSSMTVNPTTKTISTWKDKSGNNHHLTQSDTNQQPVLMDEKVLMGTGAARSMRSPQLASGIMANPVHVLMKLNFKKNPPAGFAYIFDGYSGDACAIGVAGPATVMPYQGGRFHNYNVAHFGEEQLIEVLFNGDRTKFAANGEAWNVGSDGGATDCRGIKIGGSNYLQSLSKVLVYKGELSTANRAAAGAFLTSE